MYDAILSLYRYVKHFPEKGYLITNPKKTVITDIKGKASGNYIGLDAVVYGILFTILSIMIIASTINYELIFRPKVEDKDVDYNKEFYSKSENANGLAFVVPILFIMLLILGLGFFKKYVTESKNLFVVF
jgi:hypothetical protein